jgi:hypothetical protein
MSPERPGNSPNDSKAPDLSRSGARAPDSPPEPNPVHRGFTLQSGGRTAMAEAAERIGGAMGAAQRQVLRSLELVRPAASHGVPPAGLGDAGQPEPLEQGLDGMAARMMQAIEEEVAEVRVHTAHRLGQFSGRAGDYLQQLRGRLRETVSRTQWRARQRIAERPAQTMAALAGFCLVFGTTLLLRSGHRR